MFVLKNDTGLRCCQCKPVPSIVFDSAVLFGGLSHTVTAVEADDRDADYGYEMMEDDE